jgi:hypothetical protein
MWRVGVIIDSSRLICSVVLELLHVAVVRKMCFDADPDEDLTRGNYRIKPNSARVCSIWQVPTVGRVGAIPGNLAHSVALCPVFCYSVTQNKTSRVFFCFCFVNSH